jgi:HNH endonuclease
MTRTQTFGYAHGQRKVFKFHLRPVEKKLLGGVQELPQSRIIPTSVKLEVWKRDGGKCVKCGSKDNLHYDHDIPFSKGGSSLTAANVQLLCARHNLAKSDKIICLLPWVLLGAEASSHYNLN